MGGWIINNFRYFDDPLLVTGNAVDMIVFNKNKKECEKFRLKLNDNKTNI